jgi:hypothetical protein
VVVNDSKIIRIDPHPKRADIDRGDRTLMPGNRPICTSDGATSLASESLGLGDTIGSIAPGFDGDSATRHHRARARRVCHEGRAGGEMGASAMKIERIIWAALLAAVVIYVLVAFMVAQKNAAPPFADALHRQMVLPVYAIGAVLFVIAFFLRARFRERGAPRRLRNIIAWALFEAVTIYGLVLALTASDWRLIVPPAMLTIIGFVVTFPQEEQ